MTHHEAITLLEERGQRLVRELKAIHLAIEALRGIPAKTNGEAMAEAISGIIEQAEPRPMKLRKKPTMWHAALEAIASQDGITDVEILERVKTKLEKQVNARSLKATLSAQKVKGLITRDEDGVYFAAN